MSQSDDSGQGILTPPKDPHQVKSFNDLETSSSHTVKHLKLQSEPELSLAPSIPVSRLLSHNELYELCFLESLHGVGVSLRPSLNRSYFLPSRAYGMNDIYTMHTLATSPETMTSHRLIIALAILLLRHPLLASGVRMEPGKYREAKFELV